MACLRGSGKVMWLMYDNMRNQWLMLAACFWVLFMLMVASRFIPFTFKDHDSFLGKSRVITWTAATEVQRLPIQEEVKMLQVIHQPNTKWLLPLTLRIPWFLLLPRSIKGYYIFNNGQKPTGKGLEDDLWKSQVQMDRLELLRNVCRDASLKNLTHTTISKFVLDRIFVSDEHKILFCQTPKVGNTQWKKVLIILNGLFPSIDAIPEHIVHDHEKNGIPRLSSFKEWEIEERLNSYFKFFIVRDPFERLISAFKDKFVRNPRFEPWYKHNIAPAIIRKYTKNHTQTKGLQFEDFVRYLGDPNHRRLDLQFGEHIIHWLTYVELCAPCEINYSVVGHHETLEDDVAHILKSAGIDHLVSYPAIPPGITLYNRTKVQSYFSSVSKRDIRRLYERFKGDFKLFGYPEPDFLLH